VLLGQRFNEGISRGGCPTGIAVAHKTGELTGTIMTAAWC